MEIIDHTQGTVKLQNPIKLIGCLQSSLAGGKFTFGGGVENMGDGFPDWNSGFYPVNITKVERIYSKNIDFVDYDVMLITHNGGNAKTLFVGQWNDGVWKK